MIAVTIPDDWYGPGTSKMREMCIRAARIAWFRVVPDMSLHARVESLVTKHFRLLRPDDDQGKPPDAPNINILGGSWRVLHGGRWQLGDEAWPSPWDDPASTATARAMGAGLQSRPDLRKLLRPPLWPVTGVSNVLGGAVIADSGRREQLVRVLADERDRSLAWALLGSAESRVWDAMLWEFASGLDLVHGDNPCDPLIELYELGYFPMGCIDGGYDLYVPKLTAEEIKAFAEPPEPGEYLLSWRTPEGADRGDRADKGGRSN
jgi:hypothetical protein